MKEIVKKALAATRESKRIEFKSEFDTATPGAWCELIKDVVALANSGGGIVIFGLDSTGSPTDRPFDAIASEDPAAIYDRLAKYIGAPSFEVESLDVRKRRKNLHALLISAAPIPHVFQKPGTYDIGGGKQKTAFGVGTVYFRHGAKSEYGNSSDFKAVVDRELEAVRKSWVRGVRRVVQAPIDAEIVAVPRLTSHAKRVRLVRAVNDPAAQPVLLTRDPASASAIFYHEEISEGIFDEINNVIDANRALAKGQRKFLLGQAIYFRIYAERQHVVQRRESLELLLHAALSDFYAPALFWALSLPDESVASAYLELFRNAHSPQIHSLMRIAIILGDDFSEWLLRKFNDRWGGITQPPGFYWTFNTMAKEGRSIDYRLRAARMSAASQARSRSPEEASTLELIENPSKAAAALSMACMMAFEGSSGESRAIARNLDYLAYGAEIRKRARGISSAVVQAIGSEPISELKYIVAAEE